MARGHRRAARCPGRHPPPPPAHCTAPPRPHRRALVGETPTAHRAGVDSLGQLAKCLNMLCTTDGEHCIIRGMCPVFQALA